MFFLEMDPAFAIFFFNAVSLIPQVIEACKQSKTQSCNRFHDVGHAVQSVGRDIEGPEFVVEGDSSRGFLPWYVLSIISSTVYAQKGFSIKNGQTRRVDVLSCSQY
ncbi:MAG TPA: hypothetical protein DCR17_07350 [Verrucomicrobiales bacterium]|nr:hypothetical protein [Pedosphaera sp.]MBL6843928.1 hypothetical protein [Verrucomicrobiae bacterium]HAO66486.1 hypothetical protein [Verrucomicrobiales bacterium]HAW01747.1 hypothetical protein [Verrucomicrobiales bacterium]HBP55038.1 hypothetical protein [Verrucomicrobiales bacterium]|tara:strand:- start:3090 stop:3407 length:318 start_codon:yes stop_codon:yes gene_type:complete